MEERLGVPQEGQSFRLQLDGVVDFQRLLPADSKTVGKVVKDTSERVLHGGEGGEEGGGASLEGSHVMVRTVCRGEVRFQVLSGQGRRERDILHRKRKVMAAVCKHEGVDSMCNHIQDLIAMFDKKTHCNPQYYIPNLATILWQQYILAYLS